MLRFFAAIDRARNALALRVYRVIGDDAGAIAAAMVAGKRDYLSEDARNLIRRAGIFHIVTISGVQMTLVAGIFFVGLRGLLALSRTLALNYPIKKWAAALAMAGAILYDLATGSRVGTERALVMTLIMLGAVIFDRPSLSMRNLALTVVFIVAFEPEALLGASFQLSFAAVAALVAAHEWRADQLAKTCSVGPVTPAGRFDEAREIFLERVLHGPGATLLATLCATAATASFMAADFHEISPYVLIGNPLTLAIIEFFAIPGAIIGALLYPLGLDGLVWGYLAWGIELVTWLAGLIASAPGASLHLRAFAPWALPFLALAVVSAVIWRSWTLKATALPLLAIGLAGAQTGAPFDLAIAPTGDAIALRETSGALQIVGKNQRAFAAEQWLRADGDARDAAAAKGGGCDDYGCVARATDGRLVAVIAARDAFIEDCARVAIVVTPLRAPEGCAAPIVIDRQRLAETGALTVRFVGERMIWTAAQRPGESRPWSRPGVTTPKTPRAPPESEEPETETVEPGDF
jgi:competence protein ComEC